MMTNKADHNDTPSSSSKRRVTLRDIARETGVSHPTVSRALRNSPLVSEATKLLVQKKAEEMGYNPDPMLSALSQYRLTSQEKPRQSVLAWINLFEHPEELRKYNVFDQYWEGASDTARQLGFHLEEFRWADFPPHRIDGIFKARGIRGVILSPSSYTDEKLRTELEPFPWKDYAAVRFGQSARFLAVNFISSAQVSNTIAAFEKIRTKGYKRIGFVGDHSRKMLFSAGYLWAQLSVPEDQRISPLLFPDNNHVQQQKKLSRWMKETKPDAIISTALDLLQMLNKLGYRVPEDAGLCTLSLNDTPIDAGIDQNPEEIGRAAIHTLISQLNGNIFGIPQTQRETLVEGRWTDGSMLPDRL